MMSKKKKAALIYKAAEKAKNELVNIRTKSYMKPLKSKEWHDIAIRSINESIKELEKIFQEYKGKYIKAISNKNIFIEKSKIQKNDKKYKTDEYLDRVYNHVVVDDIRDALLDLKTDFLRRLERFFDENIYNTIEDATKTVMSSVDMEFEFNEFDRFTRDYLKDKKINWGKQVAQTTEDKIKRILVDGFENGDSSFDIARKIKESSGFAFKRAEMIARTENTIACNYADYVAWTQSPDIIGKEWSATGDTRTRPSHARANGQKRKLEEPFIVGYSKLMHPGDNSLGATSKEIICCRCTMYPIFKGESLESDTIYDEKGAGSVEWLKNQSKEFQEEVLGFDKRILLQANALNNEELNKSIKELKTKGKIIIDKKIIDIHSCMGDFTKFLNDSKPEKGGGVLEKGGHGQSNLYELEKRREEFKNHPKFKEFKDRFEYNIEEILENGVRLGNIPKHKRKHERTGKNHAWFPKGWDNEKIHIAGTYVANLEKGYIKLPLNKNNGYYKYASFDGIIVGVIFETEDKVGTVFPDNEQREIIGGDK